jgi:hypothetical protein
LQCILPFKNGWLAHKIVAIHFRLDLMKIWWRLYTNCTSQKAARIVSSKHFAQAGLRNAQINDMAAHEEGGFVATCTTELSPTSWPELVFEALSVSQRVGHSWSLSGNIAEELDIWSSKSRIPGIVSIHLRMPRFPPAEANEH